MKNRNSLNKFFNRDRKILYIILCIIFVLGFTLTIVYAALSTTLNISGNAEVTAASWDIYFDNIKINEGSVEAIKVPTKINNKTIDFSVNLKEPGDYYKFTVDIVNNGSIDAMIDSVVKSPTVSETQAKYLKYDIEYTDGNSIFDKQLISKKETKTISVLVAYRSDVASNDIPTDGDSLNLSFTVNYVQADETSTMIPGSTPFVRVVSGDLSTVGSEIAIGNERFYVISNTTNEIIMLAKYNLYVGNYCTSSSSSSCVSYGNEATGVQESSMLGFLQNKDDRNGTVSFSKSAYWSNLNSSYPSYVYNSNSDLYVLVEDYRKK